MSISLLRGHGLSFPKALASLRSFPLRSDGSHLGVTNQVSDTRACSTPELPRSRGPPSPHLQMCVIAPSGQTHHRCQCAKAAFGFFTDEYYSLCTHLATEINNVKMKICLHSSCSIDEWGPSFRLLLQII